MRLRGNPEPFLSPSFLSRFLSVFIIPEGSITKRWYHSRMARRWTTEEEGGHRAQLQVLYIEQNKTIGEIARMLGVAPQTIFDRLRRVGIPTCRTDKPAANNRRSDIVLPRTRSPELAELFGVLLGDGHVGHFQVVVTLGSKEQQYARHVTGLVQKTFGQASKIAIRSNRGHLDVYLGSTVITDWLRCEGMVHHKVKAQVDAPGWLFERPEYLEAFLRGFFDTDGSVYALRYGIQLSFSNKSLPLLHSLQNMLRTLGYTPSAVSGWQLYLTKVPDVERFFREIRPANEKHTRRFNEVIRCVGVGAVNRGGL